MNLINEELSKRELEIYKYLLKGLDLYSIADELGVGRSTIATHVLHIYQKLYISSRYELLARRIKELEEEVQELKQAKCITRA